MISFLAAYGGWGTVVLRFAIGVVFIVHGWAKVQNPVGIAQAVWGGRKALGRAHGWVEVLGGLALVVGVFVSWSALVLAPIMVGAMYYKSVKWKMPFTAQNTTGWEFDLVLLAGLLTLLLG